MGLHEYSFTQVKLNAGLREFLLSGIAFNTNSLSTIYTRAVFLGVRLWPLSRRLTMLFLPPAKMELGTPDTELFIDRGDLGARKITHQHKRLQHTLQ